MTETPEQELIRLRREVKTLRARMSPEAISEHNKMIAQMVNAQEHLLDAQSMLKDSETLHKKAKVTLGLALLLFAFWVGRGVFNLYQLWTN